MRALMIRRAFVSVLTLLVISLIVFILARASGDPRSLMLDDYAGPDQWEELGKKLGLDKSYPEQYFIFLKNAVRLDFGEAINDHRPVMDLIMERMVATLQLGLAAFIFSVVVGVPLGIFSSIRRNSIWDHMGKTVALLGQSMPPFWLGIMMIFIVAVKLEWVPPSGRHDWNSFILPATTCSRVSGCPDKSSILSAPARFRAMLREICVCCSSGKPSTAVFWAMTAPIQNRGVFLSSSFAPIPLPSWGAIHGAKIAVTTRIERIPREKTSKMRRRNHCHALTREACAGCGSGIIMGTPAMDFLPKPYV